MAVHTFDIAVLGGGSAGYATALRSVQLGKSVAIIEKAELGGTCLHRGCIPTKALLHSAEIAENVKSAEKYGVKAQFDSINMSDVLNYKNSIVASKWKGLTGLLASKGITVFAGEGRFQNPTTIVVGEDSISAKNIVIATGSYSKSLPGLEISGRILTSDQALTLDVLPSRVVVLGGGVIGVEFASIWKSFGVDVTIVEAFDRLVPNEEAVISKNLERAFKKRGIKLSLGVPFSDAQQNDDGVRVTLANGEVLEADYLLVAVGRGSATKGCGAEEIGVTLDRGYVITNDRLETSLPGVYAVGDVVPGLQLAHRGYQQGIFVAEEIAGLEPRVIEDIMIPKITYCEPEIASIGYSQSAAEEKFGQDKVSSYEYNLAGNGKSSILGTSGLVKVVRVKDGPVVGVHMIGSRVGELIGEAQLAVNWEAYPEDIAPLIHAHPTQNEALGEAFLMLASKPLHSV